MNAIVSNYIHVHVTFSGIYCLVKQITGIMDRNGFMHDVHFLSVIVYDF